jgi:hypothetical protein
MVLGTRRSTSAAIRLLALPVVAVALVAGCGAGEETTAPVTPPAQEPPGTATEPAAPPAGPAPSSPPAEPTSPASSTPGELPAAVERTRDAILAAAHARDYEGLESLLDPETFSYSYGESGDPTGYWRELEEDGHVPILGDFLPLILSMRFAEVDDMYVWPAAHANDPANWTEEDIADIAMLYPQEDIESFEQAGGYLGYRVGIREDGTWIFFVAGD